MKTPKTLQSCLILCLSLLLSFGSVAFANPTADVVAEKKDAEVKYTEAELQERLGLIGNILRNGLLAEEAEDAEDANIRISKNDMFSQLADMGVYPVQVDEVANPLLKNLEDGDVGILSNPEFCIDLPTAGLFWDSQTRSYLAYAYFFWKNTAYWKADVPSGTYNTINVGGKNAFGIVFDKPIHRDTQLLQTWCNFGNESKYNTPASATKYGTAFNVQDTASLNGTGYDWDSGLITMYMTPQGSGSHRFWQEMGHTWHTTDISNVNVGTGGISMSFTLTNNRWKAIAPTTGSYTF